jgi:ABC-type antimicrobial peptide transport system permease subunit
MRPVALGFLAGGAGALAVARAMGAMLYGVQPTDAVSFAAAAGVMLVASAAAALVPARRATGVDPLRALRSQ